MKVLNSSPISSFGGINFVLKEFTQLGINNIIRQSLPKLSSQSKYKWEDILLPVCLKYLNQPLSFEFNSDIICSKLTPLFRFVILRIDVLKRSTFSFAMIKFPSFKMVCPNSTVLLTSQTLLFCSF